MTRTRKNRANSADGFVGFVSDVHRGPQKTKKRMQDQKERQTNLENG